MVPHMQPIVRPKESIQLDYEAEMVAIVGKRAKHLTMANAVDCIAGYSCSNEGSVREFQRHTTQWGMGKNFDRTGGFGPWMVTADEIPPGGKGLKIMSRLNGNTMQSDNTGNMMFPLAETLVYLTQRHDAGARRRHSHWYAVRRRSRAQARAGMDEGRRYLRDRDRRHRRFTQSNRGRKDLMRLTRRGSGRFVGHRH